MKLLSIVAVGILLGWTTDPETGLWFIFMTGFLVVIGRLILEESNDV